MPGVLDSNSIELRNAVTRQVVPHALTEDFAYSDKGRVEFVVADPKHTVFDNSLQYGRQASAAAAA